MLANLPIWIQLPLLLVCGALIGAFINWAIYKWAAFTQRRISPWTKPETDETKRTGLDYVPIIGWLGRRRDSNIHGRGFWIRPMLIEIAWAIGLPWFYHWQSSSGLTGGIANPVLHYETWFLVHTFFLAFLFIATFIDFDEKTIPDEVTVTGTLVALVVALFAPWFRLPYVAAPPLKGVLEVFPIHIGSPNDIPGFHHGIWGLVIAMVIYAIWIWALFPKLCPWMFGLKNTWRFMIAYAFQVKRKTKCDIRIEPRQTPGVTILLCVLFVIGMIAIPLAWMLYKNTASWDSMFGSFIGLAFGGGFIWAIRVIGTYALGTEAMGFGDVTLMAMIGAFLGWQAALLAFVMAPFFGMFVAVAQLVITGKTVIAFGPYLCGGAATVLFSWNWLWPRAAAGMFSLGPILIYILLGSLVLMGAMLIGLQWIKGLIHGKGEFSTGR